MLSLQESQLEELKTKAELCYPEEFCAILLGKDEGKLHFVCSILHCSNAHPDPRHAYAIPPEALIAAQRDSRQAGLRILGFVHSHPDHPAKPSPSDLEQAWWPGCFYGIVSVYAGRCGELVVYQLPEQDGRPRFQPVEIAVEPSSLDKTDGLR